VNIGFAAIHMNEDIGLDPAGKADEVSIGPAQAQETLRTAMAIGAVRATGPRDRSSRSRSRSS